MKMIQRGAMLQVGVHICSPAVQSLIWLRSLALTRAQVETSTAGAAEMEAVPPPPSIPSLQHFPRLQDPLTSCHLSLPLPLSHPPGLSGALEGIRARPPPPVSLSDTHLLPRPWTFLLSLLCFPQTVLGCQILLLLFFSMRG